MSKIDGLALTFPEKVVKKLNWTKNDQVTEICKLPTFRNQSGGGNGNVRGPSSEPYGGNQCLLTGSACLSYLPHLTRAVAIYDKKKLRTSHHSAFLNQL